MGQVLLVRHGQASWGADDYDVLSETGWEQGRLLGRALTARGIAPAAVVRGTMRRHRETAEAIGEGLALPEVVVDEGWDEFDSVDVLRAASVAAPDPDTDPAEFHRWFEEAMARWTGGEHDDYAEAFAAFAARVGEALRRTPARGTTLVVTSGGPISWCLASLLGADLAEPGRVALWRRLNPTCANTGVSKVITGRRGTSAVAWNEHTHLEPTPELITYR